MVRVYTAGNVVDARLVCDMLLGAGLDATVTGGYLSGAAGELPVDSLISVWLTEPLHAWRARELIDAFERDRLQAADECVCQHCGAETTTAFTQCWQCNLML